MTKNTLTDRARLFYHNHLSGLRKRLRAEAQAKRPGFTPYRIRTAENAAAGRPRVLHAIPTFSTGGSQQLIVDIIEETSDRYEHSLIVHNDWGLFGYTGIPIRETPGIFNADDALAVLKSFRPDILHIHYWGQRDTGYAHWRWYHALFEAGFRLGCTVVQNCNNAIVPYFDRRIDLNVFVSKYARDYFGSPQMKNVVIYPGSNFSLFTPQPGPKDPDCIGMVYRLEKDKLNEASIEPFIEVARRRPQTKVLIVGKGTYEALYRSRVAEAGVRDNFEFAGLVSYGELPAFYQRMSVFVAPVHSESFGQVTPFAMNMGLAVAGYDIGALPEILGGGEFLAPAGDAEGLAGRIIRLLDEPGLRETVARRNRERAQAHFSVPTMAAAYDAAYRRLLAEKPVRP